MNDIVTAQSTELSTLDAQLAARAQTMRDNIKVSGNVITLTKGGMLKLPDGSEVAEVELVIVDYRYRNQYYAKPYRAGEFSAADCFAVGDAPNEVLIPSSLSPNLQHPTCNTCEKNQYGSSPTGKGKACSNQFVVACMMPGTASEDIFLLKASPTAISAVAGHVLRMVDLYGHPIKVITQFSIDESKQYPRLAAAYVSPNADYEHHGARLADAARMVSALPVATPTEDAPQQGALADANRSARAR